MFAKDYLTKEDLEYCVRIRRQIHRRPLKSKQQQILQHIQHP